jgi:spore coat protein CotH
MSTAFSSILLLLSAVPLSAATNNSAASDSQLAMVYLEAQEAIVSDQRVPCTFRLTSPEGTPSTPTNALPAVIKYHGATSQAYAKKSFGVTLDAPVSLLGMRTNAHWILNAAYIDRSLMRHKLAYDLFRSLSTPGNPRYAVASRFVNVTLNQRYHGVYLLMERVDRALLELHPYHSNDTSHACIYKAIDHAANFSRSGHAGFEQREPEPLTGVYWQPLDHFNRFVATSSPPDFDNPQAGIESRLDSGNATDFFLLVLLTSNMDGITKNFILARDISATNAHLPRFFFAPWDYDGTFGRNWDASPVEPTAWLSNHLFDRLLANPAWRARLASRWKQLREREFSLKTIHGMIDVNAQILGPTLPRNDNRWPAADGPYLDKITFQKEIAQMKSWVEARLKWLDAEIPRRAGEPGK